jgi:hypothetical protein
MLPPIILIGGLFSVYAAIRSRIFIAGLPSLDTVTSLYREIGFEWQDLKMVVFGMVESVNFNVVMMIFREHAFEDMLFGGSYVKFFYSLIPRTIWSEKPQSLAIKTKELLTPLEKDLSLVTTTLGEAQFNFSYLGIVLLPVVLMVAERYIRLFPYSCAKERGLTLFIFAILTFRMPFYWIILTGFMFGLISYLLIYTLKRRSIKMALA